MFLPAEKNNQRRDWTEPEKITKGCGWDVGKWPVLQDTRPGQLPALVCTCDVPNLFWVPADNGVTPRFGYFVSQQCIVTSILITPYH